MIKTKLDNGDLDIQMDTDSKSNIDTKKLLGTYW